MGKVGLSSLKGIMVSSYTKTRPHHQMRHGTLSRSSWKVINKEYVLVSDPPAESLRSRRMAFKTMTSVSTKPWPSGEPTSWTSHQNRRYAVSNDFLDFQLLEPPPGRPKQLGAVRHYSGSLMAYLDFGAEQDLDIFVPVPTDAALYNKLRGKLKSEFNAAVALAEAHKAVGLIAQTFGRLNKAFTYIVQGKRRAAMSILNIARTKRLGPATRERLRIMYRNKRERQIAGMILELQYGWRPLLNDVYNAVEHARNEPKPLTVRVGGRVNTVSQKTFKNALPTGGPYLDRTKSVSGFGSRRITVQYRIDAGYVNRLSSVSLTNPLTVAWELLPFSFLLDWALPIGDWLNGLDATVGLSFVRGVDTWVRHIDQRDVFFHKGDNARVSGYGELVRSADHFDRNVISGFPGPVYPQIKNPLSTEHAVNALALFTSIIKVRK